MSLGDEVDVELVGAACAQAYGVHRTRDEFVAYMQMVYGLDERVLRLVWEAIDSYEDGRGES
jgi:hypothetical protein